MAYGINPAALFERFNDVRRYRDATNILNIAPCNRLTIGNDGQSLDRGLGQTLLLWLLFAQKEGQIGGCPELVLSGNTAKVYTALFINRLKRGNQSRDVGAFWKRCRQRFLIERLSPAEQAVLDDEATTWEWIVTARRPGDRQTLRVLVSNLVDVAGRLIEKGLPSQTILLDVTLTVVGPGQTFDGPALRCFGCYAPMDQPYWDALATHLALLCRQGVLSLVHERSVAPGAVFSAELEQLLTEADLVLLLVSADFLSSDLCYQDQLRLALERHGRGLAAILPILVRAADCRGAAFAHLPLSPNNGKPITLWSDRDEAWAQVATEIRAQAERLVFQRRAGKSRAGAA